MTLSQALERVNQAYVPGIVKYYGKLNPDPWQAAHDELDRIAGTFDPSIVVPATERFVSRCLDLIERFKQDGRASKTTSAADGFAMTPESVARHHSRKLKQCARCESNLGLKIVPVTAGGVDVMILCAEHAAEGRKS